MDTHSAISWGLSPTELLVVIMLASKASFAEGEIDRSLVRTALSDKELFTLAKDNEVASSVFVELRSRVNSLACIDAWLKVHDACEEVVTGYLREFDRVARKLAAKQIRVAALKNAGIARGLYPHPGAVPMGDIDVLVRKRDFRGAHQILLDDGYQFEFRSVLEEEDLDEAERGGGAEYWKILPGGDKLWLELQWRPVAGRWIRPDQEPTADELLARSIPIDGTAVRLLAPEDNLLQVCLHTAKHSYVRAPGFRLHLDVVRIVDAYPDLDWQTFVARVTRLQVKTATYFSLVIPHELFGTAVPAWVLDALRPPRWKERRLRAMIRKAGLFNPHEQKFSRAEYVLFNALLYDDLAGLLRGIFPDRNWMQAQYAFTNPLLLPYYHLKRIGSLLFRRLAT